MIWIVASAREWDSTAQMVWWCCAIAHLRGDTATMGLMGPRLDYAFLGHVTAAQSPVKLSLTFLQQVSLIFTKNHLCAAKHTIWMSWRCLYS